jgi:hypothetical protein
MELLGDHEVFVDLVDSPTLLVELENSFCSRIVDLESLGGFLDFKASIFYQVEQPSSCFTLNVVVRLPLFLMMQVVELRLMRKETLVRVVC